MARKVNPFAICKAAGKRRRWTKKKIERCIRSVKGRLGAALNRQVERKVDRGS